MSELRGLSIRRDAQREEALEKERRRGIAHHKFFAEVAEAFNRWVGIPRLGEVLADPDNYRENTWFMGEGTMLDRLDVVAEGGWRTLADFLAPVHKSGVYRIFLERVVGEPDIKLVFRVKDLRLRDRMPWLVVMEDDGGSVPGVPRIMVWKRDEAAGLCVLPAISYARERGDTHLVAETILKGDGNEDTG